MHWDLGDLGSEWSQARVRSVSAGKNRSTWSKRFVTDWDVTYSHHGGAETNAHLVASVVQPQNGVSAFNNQRRIISGGVVIRGGGVSGSVDWNGVNKYKVCASLHARPAAQWATHPPPPQWHPSVGLLSTVWQTTTTTAAATRDHSDTSAVALPEPDSPLSRLTGFEKRRYVCRVLRSLIQPLSCAHGCGWRARKGGEKKRKRKVAW